MDFEEKDAEGSDEVLYKRRSSILKAKDDTTRLQSQGVVLKRRVSFHNIRKVQQFDKDNCDLHPEVQEEPLHLTNNSDHLKNEHTMSTSFVAGAHFHETVDASMTLTFLSGPQAISTPHRPPHNSISNTTFSVFKNAETGHVPQQPVNSEPIMLNNETFQDKTFVIFDKIEAAARGNDKPSNISFDCEMMEVAEIVADLECEVNNSNGSAARGPIDDLMSESRWSQAFHNDDSSLGTHHVEKEADKTPMLFDDQSMNFVAEELGNQTFEINQLSTSFSPANVQSSVQKPTEPSWFGNGDSQTLLDDIVMNEVDLLQLSTTEQATKRLERLQSDTKMNEEVTYTLKTTEVFSQEIEMTAPRSEISISQFTMNLPTTENLTKSVAVINTISNVEPKADELTNKTNSNFDDDLKENIPTDKANVSLALGKKKQSFLSGAADFESTIPDFEGGEVNDKHSLFGESLMVQSALMSRRILGDTMNTRQIGKLAFNEPTEPLSVLGDESFNVSAKSGAAILVERSLMGGAKRRKLHQRRRSSILLSVDNNVETIVSDRRKSLLNSPSLVTTNESFSATVIDLEEAKRDLSAFKLIHERKQRLYEIINSFLKTAEDLANEEKRVDTELATSFKELLKKMQES